MTLRELATAINGYLKKIEHTRTWPANGPHWHNAGCYYMGGARLRITYRSYEGATTLSRPKAQAYLDWLEAGNIGEHTAHVSPNAHASTQRLDGGK